VLGWVVGNAGFLGAVAIILLAKSVTICTGLSMSSFWLSAGVHPGFPAANSPKGPLLLPLCGRLRAGKRLSLEARGNIIFLDNAKK